MRPAPGSRASFEVVEGGDGEKRAWSSDRGCGLVRGGLCHRGVGGASSLRVGCWEKEGLLEQKGTGRPGFFPQLPHSQGQEPQASLRA